VLLCFLPVGDRILGPVHPPRIGLGTARSMDVLTDDVTWRGADRIVEPPPIDVTGLLPAGGIAEYIDTLTLQYVIAVVRR
jgi:hypothetical protein